MFKFTNRRFARKLIILCVTLSSAAARPVLAKEEWAKIDAGHFSVVSNAGRRDMRGVATQLELFNTVFGQLFPRARINTAVPTTIILFKNHYSFRPFKPKYKGKTNENIGGYFIPGWDENYITLTAEKRGGNPFEVIFHEYVHYVLNNTMKNPPVWLNEGLAEYYSTFVVLDEDAGRVRIGTPIGRHIMTLRERGLIPISKLLAVNRKSPEYNERSKAGVFYAESWALMHYLLNGSKDGKRLPQLKVFLAQLSSGVDLDQAFKQSFQTDYATIEAELRQYVGRFSFPVLEGTLEKGGLNKLTETAAHVTPLSEAQAQYHLINLQQRVGRYDDASERLEKAALAAPDDAPLASKLAMLRVAQDRLDEAEQLLGKAATTYATDYRPFYYYGVLANRRDEPLKAAEYFRKASTLWPESAWIIGDLSLAYLRADKHKESDEAFTRAIRLDPTNERLLHRRAYACLENRRGTQAAYAAVRYLNQQGWGDPHSDYVALVAYLGYRQAGKTEAADEMANAGYKKSAETDWVRSVWEYYRKEIAAEVLIERAGEDPDKLTEAHAYVGLDLSLKGEREAALAHLRWVKEKGNKNFVEYPLATAELGRLEADAKTSSTQ